MRKARIRNNPLRWVAWPAAFVFLTELLEWYVILFCKNSKGEAFVREEADIVYSLFRIVGILAFLYFHWRCSRYAWHALILLPMGNIIRTLYDVGIRGTETFSFALLWILVGILLVVFIWKIKKYYWKYLEAVGKLKKIQEEHELMQRGGEGAKQAGSKEWLKDIRILEDISRGDLKKIPKTWSHMKRSYVPLLIQAYEEEKPGVNTLWVYVLHGLIYSDAKYLKEAEGLVRGAVAEDELLQILGFAYFCLSQSETSLRYLRKAVELNPSLQNLQCLIHSLDGKGPEEISERLQLSQQILKIDPDYIPALLGIAYHLIQSDRADASRSYLERAKKKDPHFAGTRQVWGDYYYEKGDFQKAFLEYQETFRRSKYKYPIGMMAQCLLLTKQVGKARKTALAAQKIDPQFKLAKWLIEEIEGKRYEGIEDFDYEYYPATQAKLDFERGQGKDGERANLYYYAMESLKEKDIGPLREALPAMGGLAEHVVKSVYGRIAFQVGEKEEGLAEMRKAVEMKRTILTISSLLACLSKEPETEPEAKALQEELAGLFERQAVEYPEERGVLFDLRIEGEYAERWLAIYLDEIQRIPDFSYPYFKAGQCCFELGRYGEAVEYFRKSYDYPCGPDDYDVFLALSRCYERMGQMEKMRNYARMAAFEEKGLEEAEKPAEGTL